MWKQLVFDGSHGWPASPSWMSTSHSSGVDIGSGPLGHTVALIVMPSSVKLSGVVGIAYCSAPPGPVDLSRVSARPPALLAMKSSPERVTRAAAAFAISSAGGNPWARGVTPHPAHPLEQPPPLHDATMRKKSTA